MLWQNDENDNFDVLDDNCCYEIMCRLPLDDLCALSQTCVRLYNLSVRQFQLDYPAKEMHIQGIDNDGKLITEPKQEKFIAAFEKGIRNIVLHGDELESKLDVVNSYYNQDETTKGLIKQIRLVHWCNGDFTNAGQTLASLLEMVETIVFDYVWIETDWYDTILKYTPNIKNLTVSYLCIFNQQQNWLENVYPKLESFQYFALTLIQVGKLKAFLQLNPTVRHVSLYTDCAEDVIDWIKNDVKVDELFFNIRIGYTDGLQKNQEHHIDFLRSQVAALTDLIKAQNTKLHLMIGDQNSVSEKKLIAEISLLKSNIVGLYFPSYRKRIGRKLAIAMGTLENLRVLLVAKCAKITTQLPKLEELLIPYGFNIPRFDILYKTLRRFVEKSVTLEKIYIWNICRPFTQFNFAKLDRKRMKLAGARKLKIYIHSLENDNIGKLDDIEQTYKCIEIIRTAVEPPNNPLLDHMKYSYSTQN